MLRLSALLLFICLQAFAGQSSAETLEPLPPPDRAPEDRLAGGAKYQSCDISLRGAGDFRLYFDCHDPLNYHFLERRAGSLRLGLSEAGSEQVLASSQLEDPAAELRLARHGCVLGVFLGPALVCSALDDRLEGGSVALRMLSEGPVLAVAVAAWRPICFADDFMTAEPRPAHWHGNGDPARGEFKVRQLEHPVLSANAFCYMGAGLNVHSVVGQAAWDSYRLKAALRGKAASALGLVFAYRDAQNYGLFRWTARSGSDVGRRELLLVRGGQAQVLAASGHGYEPEQWYAAEVEVSYAGVRVKIDGHRILAAAHPCLCAGAAGVWCDVPLPDKGLLLKLQQSNSLYELMKQHAVFDDVSVESLHDFQDNFVTGGELSGGWLLGGGQWQVQRHASSPTGLLTVRTAGATGKALIGDRRWSGYHIDAEVLPDSGTRAGIVFLHRDESNYYAAVLEGETLKLNCVAEGRELTVDSAPLGAAKGGRLRVLVARGHIRATFAGEDDAQGPSVETFDEQRPLRGRVGLLAQSLRAHGSAQARFGPLRVSCPAETEALVTNAIFEGDPYMAEFRSGREWVPAAGGPGRPGTLLVHPAGFPGEVELVVEPREILEPRYQLGLCLSRDEKGASEYALTFRAGDPADPLSKPATVTLGRSGELARERTLESVRQLRSLGLRRCGKFIVGSVNGQAVIVLRDNAPLAGAGIGIYTQGLSVRSEAAKIISRSFVSETFSRAPVGWRTAGPTIAEITNRWICDPRWSFFSIKNDEKRGRPAVLWSKQLWPGDVTLEFFLGKKMQERHIKSPYERVRDMNVTIASDGADLTKGYTFMFGGQGNAGSMILRNGVEVKRNQAKIPSDMTEHNQWFHVQITRRGGKVTFRVGRYFPKGDVPELVYDDPQPLDGDRIALWTYDSAMIISRVRISGQGAGVLEEPDRALGPLKTPYE